MTFTFSHAISGAGLQIQTDQYGPFTAQVSAFDQNGNFLFTESGTSTANSDNSAIYLGFDDSPNLVSTITYSLTDAPNGSTRCSRHAGAKPAPLLSQTFYL